MTSDGHIFDKLWVIESLPARDLKTGTNLVENQLKSALQIQPELEVELVQPVSKAEMITVLHRIRDCSHKGQYPMIHFECHGCEEGLGTASDELIKWDELREVLIEINRNCRLNLVIVIAACMGAHLIKVSTTLDGAAFWAIIGPEGEVGPLEIQINFGDFYKKYFETLNGDEAINVLNQRADRSERKYVFVSAAGIFARAYRAYNKNHCIGKGNQQKIEELQFEKLRKRFFFINEYPENDARFAFSREQIIAPDNP